MARTPRKSICGRSQWGEEKWPLTSWRTTFGQQKCHFPTRALNPPFSLLPLKLDRGRPVPHLLNLATPTVFLRSCFFLTDFSDLSSDLISQWKSFLLIPVVYLVQGKSDIRLWHTDSHTTSWRPWEKCQQPWKADYERRDVWQLS